MKNKKKIISELLQTTDKQFSDEQLIDMLLDQKVAANLNENAGRANFGQRAADAVARFAGSWAFIFSFLGVMIVWMVLNVLLAVRAFDPYPFILLNLVLSCIAAVQAPLIMMSQNRQEEKDRARAENDYLVNLKSELILDDLYAKINTLSRNQNRILKLLEKEALDQETQGNPAAEHQKPPENLERG